MRREEFTAHLAFTPDPFQVEAMDALDAGASVVVAAPTGAGKTVVAEYGIARALDAGCKAFYTSPLKALSNQKYGDLVAAYGPRRVGLLTGDNSINAGAEIVVMTTEVLRNMVYAHSNLLVGLGCVVLDEVHYLQDRVRGAVWEEVIIHLPADVAIVALSATVSNVGELAGWIESLRGPTVPVQSTERPVPLHNLYCVTERQATDRVLLMPMFRAGRPNTEVLRLEQRAERRRARLSPPRRDETIATLGDRDLLPAIYFVFSRKGCEAAVEQVARSGIRLTTPDEAKRIRHVAEERTQVLSDRDLDVLGYDRWVANMELGLAPHHAGMVPAFKETVEELFLAGLLRAVFATETLSLGIHMPARSVVIESLTKFNGEGHDLLTPGEYAQLTGRAGRRGIDEEGFSVVLHQRYVPFAQVADLAAAPPYPLESSFRPTYNMAVNLVANHDRDEAFRLVESSFAQYRARTERARLEDRLRRARKAAAGYWTAAEDGPGDIVEYADLQTAARRHDDAEAAVWMGRAGDILHSRGGPVRGRFVVLARRHGDDRKASALLMSETGKVFRATVRDFPAGARIAGHLELPTPYAPTDRAFQRDVLDGLRTARLEPPPAKRDDGNGAKAAALAAHPAHRQAATGDRLRWLERARRADRDVAGLERRLDQVRSGLRDQLEHRLSLLERLGYVDGWALTPAGEQLRYVYNEADLILAEALGRGLFLGLDGPQVAALASAFTYEARRDGPSSGMWPTAELRRRDGRLTELVAELHDLELRAYLDPQRPPDSGFAVLAHAWASGHELDEILTGDEDLAGGDFVRNCRLLIDLLRQLRDASPPGTQRDAFRAAIAAVDRGVVAASEVSG